MTRLGVDIHHEYVAGTPEAKDLQLAWTQRQIELKEMMDKQLKAADYMTTLAGKLVNSSASDDEVVFHLQELEQLLSDIDNARDFHTIGGWPALTSLLPGAHKRPESETGGGGQDRSLAVQTMAAHCIGTAVKNDYDFQLWVLEEAGGGEVKREEDKDREGEVEVTRGGRTVLDLLLSALHETCHRIITMTADAEDGVSGTRTGSETETGTGEGIGLKTKELDELDGMQRRLLYALSAAVRGNLDVQAAVSPPSPSEGGEGEKEMSGRSHPPFVNLLKTCVEEPALSVGVKRKCWHIVSDLLDEMVYIRHDVAQEYASMQQQQEQMAEVEVTGQGVDILDILKSLRPMGMMFVTPHHDWLLLAAEVVAEIASTCTLTGEGERARGGGAGGGKVASTEECILRTSPQVRDIFAHAVKIKATLLTEFNLDLQAASDGPDSSVGSDVWRSSVQLTKLKRLEEQHSAEVELFLKHPLMQDKLY